MPESELGEVAVSLGSEVMRIISLYNRTDHLSSSFRFAALLFFCIFFCPVATSVDTYVLLPLLDLPAEFELLTSRIVEVPYHLH